MRSIDARGKEEAKGRQFLEQLPQPSLALAELNERDNECLLDS